MTFDATPSGSSATSPINSVIALSNGAQTAYTGFATLVAFNASGIQARNGGTYTAASAIPYTGGLAYHFREVINVATHTYSIFVTAPGGVEQTVGSNFAFRTEQNTVTQLNNWGIFASAGSATVCNFTLGTTGGASDFSMATTPSSLSVTTGSSGSYTVTTSALNGFSGSVALSVSGVRDGELQSGVSERLRKFDSDRRHGHGCGGDLHADHYRNQWQHHPHQLSDVDCDGHGYRQQVFCAIH